MDRKEFISRFGYLSVGGYCLGASAIFQGCAPVKYIRPDIIGNQIKINKSAFEGNPFVVVENIDLPGPIYLKREENERYHAMLLVCTHKQCELEPAKTRLECSCHGSQYSNSGKVLRGPAPSDLKKYKVVVGADEVIIQL